MRVFERRLELSNPWTVSHGTSTSRTNVFVDLGNGLGEAPIVPYYPYTAADVRGWLEEALRLLARDPEAPVDRIFSKLPDGPPPARSALDMAMLDRRARAEGVPVYRLFDLEAAEMPTSSITLSIPEDLEAYVDAIRTLTDWPILKIKLGSGSLDRDEQVARLASENHPGRLCVDANGGWTVDEAAHMIGILGEMDFLFVEEPLKVRDPKAWESLRRGLSGNAPPLLADESIQKPDDLEVLAPYIDGINVKLAKAGGISPSFKMIRRARELGLQTLIGCMVESSLAVTAAAHLSPVANYADLDGHLHLARDPFLGVRIENGMIQIPAGPGLGVRQVEGKSSN